MIEFVLTVSGSLCAFGIWELVRSMRFARKIRALNDE